MAELLKPIVSPFSVVFHLDVKAVNAGISREVARKKKPVVTKSQEKLSASMISKKLAAPTPRVARITHSLSQRRVSGPHRTP
jgi:hypothetical protein